MFSLTISLRVVGSAELSLRMRSVVEAGLVRTSENTTSV
jgi:hypothetical protein